jgi:glutaredoxin 3
MNVKIYTTPSCGYCQQAKSYLRELGVPFQEIDVSRDRAAADEMVNLTGQMGVPVIVIDGQTVVGFDRARIRELLSGVAAALEPLRFGLKIADALTTAPRLGLNPQQGAIIGDVSAGLLGEKAGFKSGDIVTQINGGRIEGAGDMENALKTLKSGNIVTFLFLRAGETRKSEIVI